MDREAAQVELSMVGVGLLWGVGAALLCWATVGGPYIAGEWAHYIAAAAAVWSVVIAMTHCRRRVVAAVIRELATAQRRQDEERGGGLRQV